MKTAISLPDELVKAAESLEHLEMGQKGQSESGDTNAG